MTRINALRNIAATNDSVAWGKGAVTALWGNVNALVFAAVLIACSVTIGCSSEKPKPISSNQQIPVTQPQMQPAPTPAPVLQAANNPAPKKVVRRKPSTANYTDKTYGVTFEYPRRYAIETGDAAADVVLTNPIAMNFVQPGGVALAAVELPMTGFANTDFSSAFFNVSVNRNLTVDQCGQFAVPQPKEAVTSEIKSEPMPSASGETAQAPTSSPSAEPQQGSVQTASSQASPVAEQPSEATVANASEKPATDAASNSKLLGDMELRATEAVAGEGTRQSDSKYFHVYQNGACYEFALNVTTNAPGDGLTKHVDRDKVFSRLEKILGTVKINPLAPETTAEAPAPTPAPVSPAQ